MKITTVDFLKLLWIPLLEPSVILFPNVTEIQHKIIEGFKVRLFSKARILTFRLALRVVEWVALITDLSF